MSEEKLKIRKDLKKRKPKFVRQDIQKKSKLEVKWRRPKGLQSKLRLNKKGHRRSVSKGWKSPSEVRSLAPSGLRQIIVKNENDLKNMDPKIDGALISSTVGMKKRIIIIKKAAELKIRLLNVPKPDEYLKKVEDMQMKKKEEKEHKKKTKEAKKKETEKKAKEKKEKEDKEGLSKKVDEEEKTKQEKIEKNKILTQKS